MKTSKLNKDAAQSSIERWMKQEGYARTKSGRRLQVIAELMDENGEINLQTLVEELFEDVANPLNSISKLSQDIEQKAKDAGFELRLVKGGSKKSSLNERVLYLEGDDLQTDRILKEQEQATAQAESKIDNPAIPAKPTYHIVVGYAQKEAAMKEELLDYLSDYLGIYQDVNLELKDFDDVGVGEHQTANIQKHLNEATFLLLLESPAFHNDKSIREHLLDSTYPIEYPCILSITELPEEADRGKLDGLHTFKLGKKSYDKLVGTQKKEFAKELSEVVRKKIKPLLEAHKKQFQLLPTERIQQKMPIDHGKYYIDPEVQRINFVELRQKQNQSTESSGKAIGLLNAWLEEEQPSLFALLGQYGMGKTFTSRVFARQQIQSFRAKESEYFPIYFDLRDLDYKLLEKEHFDIWRIIDAMLSRRKDATEDDPLKAIEIKKVWESQPTLLIFDGLDEVIAHLENPRLEGVFLDEILKLVPHYRSNVQIDSPKSIKSKMLLTCRTDYFKSLEVQASYFQSNSRKGTDAKKDYTCCVLLPFNETQIKSYLKQVLTKKDENQIYQMFLDIHNLAELSSRPVLLSFLTEIIDDIEQRVLAQKTITTATVYERMVSKTFERDSDKHEIKTEIKLEILEDIAAYLWKRSTRRINFDRLAKFLAKLLSKGSPDMRKLFQKKQTERLYKDLRNATLLTRSSEKDFGFSHTSIQEYFLARFIVKSIVAKNYAALDIGKVSRESLDFVLDILKEADIDDLAEINAGFQTAFDGTSSLCRRLIFELYLKDQKQDQRLQKPHPLDLSGLTFERFPLAGTPNQPLDLSHAIFEGSLFHDNTWRYLNLNHSNFRKAQLYNTHFRQLSLQQSNFSAASIKGGKWRAVDAPEVITDKTTFEQHYCFKSNWPTQHNLALAYPNTIVPQLIEGHTNSVLHCALVGEDKALSCSDDNSLILWDLKAGKSIHRLEGHTNSVLHCALVGEDKALSCSSDGSMRLWDLVSGECLSIAYHIKDSGYAFFRGATLLDHNDAAWHALEAKDVKTGKRYWYDEVF
ncbi:MAG: pentapeptide repeat-containing protein [Bacteroidota bacterium]